MKEFNNQFGTWLGEKEKNIFLTPFVQGNCYFLQAMGIVVYVEFTHAELQGRLGFAIIQI